MNSSDHLSELKRLNAKHTAWERETIQYISELISSSIRNFTITSSGKEVPIEELKRMPQEVILNLMGSGQCKYHWGPQGIRYYNATPVEGQSLLPVEVVMYANNLGIKARIFDISD
jgi:hypothetical protein